MKLDSAVYRSILEKARSGRPELTENGIAKELGISPNTVSIAVHRLVAIGAATVYKRHFEVSDLRRALAYWAATRKLDSDIIYATYAKQSVASIEHGMPNEIAFTAFSGYSLLFSNDVSDYSEVYVYATKFALTEIKRRFPKKRLSERSGYANVVVLQPDKVLARDIAQKRLEKSSVPPTQIYADLWNLKQWYARRFEEKLFDKLGSSKKAGAADAERLLQ